MMRYICHSCARGEHRFCAGRQAPPPGMLGGSECICDGKCRERAAAQVEDALQMLWDSLPTGGLSRTNAQSDLQAEGLA